MNGTWPWRAEVIPISRTYCHFRRQKTLSNGRVAARLAWRRVLEEIRLLGIALAMGGIQQGEKRFDRRRGERNDWANPVE